MDWSTIAICIVAGYSAFIVGCVCSIGLSRIEKALAVLFLLSFIISLGLLQFLDPVPADVSSPEVIDAHFKWFDSLSQVIMIFFYSVPVLGALFLISATFHSWQSRAKLLPFFVYQSKSATTDENDPD